MPGRTWKDVEGSAQEKIKSYLLDNGGIQQETKSPYEVWRVGFSDIVFTCYTSGKLYATPSNSNDPAVTKAWEFIDSIAGMPYAVPSKKFLIGLDETGKGEIIGHVILTGVIIPSEIFSEIDRLIGPADTKNRRSYEYWDGMFKKLDKMRNSGFDFIIEKIPPWDVDKYNLNKIMDLVYQRILDKFSKKVSIGECRIVLDNYGTGAALRRFLYTLEEQGAEIVVTEKAEDKYLEAKAASLVSKRTREAVVKAINDNQEFQIDGLSVGSGNAGNKQTIEWLKKWHTAGKDWPWFIKKSFRTVRQIEGKTKKVLKSVPTIDESSHYVLSGERRRGRGEK
ncbi:MAG: hypothetical protein AB1546_06985 [bacterium]